MRSILITVVSVCVALTLGRIPANAQSSPEDPWEILAEPGVHALMRHAIAPGTGDPAQFKLGDCSTQRNLDDTGKSQARTTGKLIRAQGIAIDIVLSSQWCRCLETAALLDLAAVQEEPALNSFFSDRGMQNSQTNQTIERLGSLPTGMKALMVTHQVNITALTGIYPQSGEIILIRVTDNGDITTVGRLMPDASQGT
ncbi:histidine phosphatase family protein [Thalassospira lucentensis]|nr:histidine phosphatase family protein [Thalassospira lucentensis]